MESVSAELYCLPLQMDLIYLRSYDMSTSQSQEKASEVSEEITPEKLRYGLCTNSPLNILRQGLRTALNNDAPDDVLDEIENQIQEEKERLKCQKEKA